VFGQIGNETIARAIQAQTVLPPGAFCGGESGASRMVFEIPRLPAQQLNDCLSLGPKKTEKTGSLLDKNQEIWKSRTAAISRLMRELTKVLQARNWHAPPQYVRDS
jgi:hypothetical protein